MSRWRQLRANAGVGGVVRVVLVGAVLVLAPLWMLVNDVPEAPVLVVIIAGAVAAPFFLRGALTAEPERSSAALRYGGYGLAGVALTSSLWREHVPDMVVALLVFGALALYISAFFGSSATRRWLALTSRRRIEPATLARWRRRSPTFGWAPSGSPCSGRAHPPRRRHLRRLPRRSASRRHRSPSPAPASSLTRCGSRRRRWRTRGSSTARRRSSRSPSGRCGFGGGRLRGGGCAPRDRVPRRARGVERDDREARPAPGQGLVAAPRDDGRGHVGADGHRAPSRGGRRQRHPHPHHVVFAPGGRRATLHRAAHARGPEVLAMSSSTLVTWSEGKLMVWDLEERARRLVVEAPPIAALAGDRLAFVDGGEVVLERPSGRGTIPVAGVRALELSRDGEHVVVATADAVLRAHVDGTVQWRADVSSPLGLYLRDDGNVVTARGELDAATGAATPPAGSDAGGTWLKQSGAFEAFGGMVCPSGRFPETGFDFLDQFGCAAHHVALHSGDTPGPGVGGGMSAQS